MASTMRAIRVNKFGGPEVLQVENVPVPKYGSKEVLIRVHAAGVNPVETYIRAGLFPGANPPYTPGSDVAGVIEAVGDGVTNFKVGDRVFATFNGVQGAYAEFCVCNAHCCYPLSQRLNFAQGGAIGVPYFTAYRCLFQKAHARPSQSILVHGASGAVGLATVQLARAHGMTVYGTAGTEQGLNLVKQVGAHHVFNHRNPEYVGEMKKVSGGGFDVIFEMAGNVNLAKDCDLAKMHGTIVLIGARGNAEIDPRLVMGKDITIMGMTLAFGVSDDRDWADMGAALVSGFDSGTLTPIIDKQYPLEKAADAHRDIIESSGAKGNLVLTMGH